MKKKDKILDLIFKQFKYQKDCISELFNESGSFRSICEDYYDCKKVLDDSMKKSSKIADLQKEYQLLLSEIEDELLERITL